MGAAVGVARKNYEVSKKISQTQSEEGGLD